MRLSDGGSEHDGALCTCVQSILHGRYAANGRSAASQNAAVTPGKKYHTSTIMLPATIVLLYQLSTILHRTDGQSLPPSLVADIDQHPTWDTLDTYDCGESYSDRIIGGVEANLGQYPWIARLGYTMDNDPEVEFKCGATLVSPSYVLTAAHCVVNLEQGLKLATVRLGEHDERVTPDCRQGACAPPVQDFRAVRAAPHRLFNKPLFSHDIAIIELDHPAVLNGFVAPICLPRGPLLTVALLGQYVTVAGWGLVNMTTLEHAPVLQAVQLPVLPLSGCHEYSSIVKITDAQICAGAQTNKDACGGDSGGPLMKVFDSDEGPKTYLMGVVSFGPEICGIRKPGIYTTVTHYMLWILDHIAR